MPERSDATPADGSIAAFDPLAARPEYADAMAAMLATLKAHQRLPHRLTELIRLRIAFRNQCRPCMSMRYGDAVDDGVTEAVVCSLARPEEAADLTAAEKAAIAFADRLAVDHLSIAPQRDALAEHFDGGEIAEIVLFAATFIGFGRIKAVFDDGMAHAVGERRADGAPLAPWGVAMPLVVR